MIQGINHVALSVPELDAAIRFYGGLLGFELVERSAWKAGSAMSRTAARITGVDGTAAEAAHLHAPNLLLELFQFTAGGAQPQAPERVVIDHGITHLCLAVEDLDAEYARLRAAGVAFLSEPVRIAPGLRTVYGRDPFGNVFELEEAAGRRVPEESALSAVKHRLSVVALGALFLLAFGAFCLWQMPWIWNAPLTPREIDRYAASIEEHAIMPEAEKAAFIARVRAWAAEDDGRPVLLVNLMRYRDTLGELPPGIDFQGSPHEANEYYEQRVAPLALRRGEYPMIGGDAQGRSLIVSALDTVAWDRVVVMRAPSRRAFIEFMADPDYGPTVPYKLASEDVVLIPVDAQMIVPELRWLVGGALLALWLAFGWWRAAGRVPGGRPSGEPAR